MWQGIFSASTRWAQMPCCCRIWGWACWPSRAVPELERHASTQMTIHNKEGALWANRAGFKRAVLAREVGLDEIKEMEQKMKKDPSAQGIGLEVFVHGALCYSYSGQCLLSSAIGGRSGNRGMCAQPCRKPYVLLRGEKDSYGRPTGLAAQPQREQFLISTRDLCVYRHLDRIVRSPVESLKIEGRMKSPEYVAIVTSVYRRALQAIAKGKWSPSPEDERDLALSFNRDFTEGHLLGARDVMGREMSDNRGVLIGSVASFDGQRGEAAVRLSGPFCPEKGDGLVFSGTWPGDGPGGAKSGAKGWPAAADDAGEGAPGGQSLSDGQQRSGQKGAGDHRLRQDTDPLGSYYYLAGGHASAAGHAGRRPHRSGQSRL